MKSSAVEKSAMTKRPPSRLADLVLSSLERSSGDSVGQTIEDLGYRNSRSFRPTDGSFGGLSLGRW